MPQQPMTRNERLKKLAQMRIDYLKKMEAARHGRTPSPDATPRTTRPTRTV